MKIRSFAPLAAGALATLAGLTSLAGRAQSGHRGAPGSLETPALIDGGTIHAQGVIVPRSIKKEREPVEERKLPFIAIASPDVIAALGDFKPVVGAWCEYEQVDHGHVASKFMVSVLPPVMPDGRYWLEIDAINELTPATAVRVLAHGNPVGPASFERVIVQVASQPLFEVPFAALPKPPPPSTVPSGAKITKAEHVKVKVPGGTFDTERIHLVKGKEDFLVWRSDDLPLFGLVRTESKGIVVELTGSGRTGAHSLLTTPVPDENLPAARDPGDEFDQGNGSDSK